MSRVSEVFIETGDRVYPDLAREITSRLVAGMGQPSLFSAFFHYTEGAGSIPVSGLAPIAFGSHGKGFTIVALNDEGRAILNAALPFVLGAWQKHLGRSIKVDIKDHKTGARWVPFKMRYRLHKAVVCKKPEQKEFRGEDAPHEIRLESIGKLIKRSLLSYAASAGVELPEHDKIKVCVIDHGPAFYATVKRTDNKRTLGRLGYKDVEFDINLDLSGYWMLGNLRSNGFGHLKASLNQKLKMDQRLSRLLQGEGHG